MPLHNSRKGNNMATVRMSDGLKNVMFRKLSAATPAKQTVDVPQQLVDDIYNLWAQTPLGRACQEIVATYPEEVVSRILDTQSDVRVSSINGRSVWGRYTPPSGTVWVPRRSGYTDFTVSIENDTSPEATRIVAQLEAIQTENKARSEENSRIEKEMRAMLDSAPTLNGVLKKYPFLRDITPPEALDTLKKKVVRQKKEVVEPELSEEAAAIQRRIKVGLVAQKVSGE